MKENDTIIALCTMTVYLIVSNDPWELPIYLAYSLQEISNKFNIPLQTVKNCVCCGRLCRKLNCKIEKVEISTD